MSILSKNQIIDNKYSVSFFLKKGRYATDLAFIANIPSTGENPNF